MKPFKTIYKLIKVKPWLFIITCIVAIIFQLLPLLPGLVMKSIFDYLSGKTHFSFGLWGLIVLLVATYAARILSSYAMAIAEVYQRFSISAFIRRNLLLSIFDKPGAKKSSKPTGDILSSFRDDAYQVEDFVSQTIDIIATVIYTVVALIILLSINVKITLLVFTPLVGVVAIARIAGAKVTRYRKASRKSTVEVTSAISEMFSSVQAIQVANAQQSVINNFKKLNNNRQMNMLKDNMFTQFLSSVFNNAVGLGTGLILLSASSAIKTGSFSIGDFAVFTYYLVFVSDFTQFLGTYIAEYKQTEVSIERMLELMKDSEKIELTYDKPLYIKGNIPKVQYNLINTKDKFNTLQVKNLGFHYKDTRGGIENINFNINKDSFTVITGRVGSGKTTLLRVLLGLLAKEEGDIYWNGKIIEKPDEFFIPPRSSYTPQVPHLLSDTVRNNILLGIDEKDVNIEQAIKNAVLEVDIEKLDNALDTLIGSKGTKLSGGQQQRVAAARMFARNTDILLFDDISSALDVETEKLLWERILKESNKTCIAVSNRHSALSKADNVIVLKDGRIEAQGKLQELLNSCEEMKLIWG